MITEVIMKRELFGCEISQKSKTEFFSATDLVKAGNKWRLSKQMTPFNMSEWFRQKRVKEFIRELESIFGKVKISGRGRGSHTWVHPFLFIDMALAINPRLKVEVYGWLYDKLLKYRNDSGDSYKLMCGSIYRNMSNKSQFHQYITNVACKIKLACDVNDWQKANEEQLSIRDEMHNSISLLSDVLSNTDEAVRLGILKVLDRKKRLVWKM